MSKNPFRFGTPVDVQQLIGRRNERRELVRSLRENINLALVAPRGMGKTSLLRAVLADLPQEGVHGIYVDLFPAINARRFAEIYASALTLEPSRTVQSMQEAVQQLVPSFMPRVTITGSGKPGLQLDLWDRDRDIRLLLERILDAPAQLSREGGQPVVVIFDDFEDLLAVSESSLLQSLAQVVRRHRDVRYVFVLRKESTATERFNEPKGTFYRLAEPVGLDPVPDRELVAGLEEAFQTGGLRVDLDLLFGLTSMADHTPHYVQMLAHALFEEGREKGTVEENDLRAALAHVLGALAYGYKHLWDGLSVHQRNLVLAIAQGYTERLHSQRMVFQLGLGAPSTVSKNLRTLSEREILQKRGERVHFVDPFFGLWLQRRMT